MVKNKCIAHNSKEIYFIDSAHLAKKGSILINMDLMKIIDKMEEEFAELKEALKDKSNIVHEAADTIYHMLVTLEAADIKFEDVLKELENRKKQSGINERNNR